MTPLPDSRAAHTDTSIYSIFMRYYLRFLIKFIGVGLNP
ncbi:hypothetical protein YSA_02854 [Pseudomonas putida ND6]|uniref:Uncharacterized protein n=1 Tax=Pseudomonas putida ND6 TaxID=231023 RepID=I3US48_PSEPU|nr:hypothetical protein YSA_02854 [Pseudomonas putida ND6]